MLSLAHFPWGFRSLEARTDMSTTPDMWCSQILCIDYSRIDLHTLLVGGVVCYLAITLIYRVASRMCEAMQELEEEMDLKERIEERRKAMDEASGFGEAKSEPKADEKEDSYEKDFDTETKISELKAKKKELLKGISGKKGAERKEIESKLKELNDKIMDLESS